MTTAIRYRRWLLEFTLHPGAAFLACALIGCAPKPTAPVVEVPSSRIPYTSDFPFTWAPDGRSFAFRRVMRSSAGLPGIYTTGIGDWHPRYVFPANLLWPRHGAFSPHGNLLVLSYALRIYVLDMSAGTSYSPFYTPSGADFPAWVEGDSVLMYVRMLGGASTPPESTGIHIFRLSSRRDSAWRINGEIAGGAYVCTSPIDGRVAFKDNGPEGQRIRLASPDGNGAATLFQAPPLHYIDDLQWSVDAVRGSEGVAFTYGSGPEPYPTMLADVSGAQVKSIPGLQGPFDRISPDGSSFLTTGIAAGDSVISVFVHSVSDPFGRPPVQVTWWRRP